MNHLARLKHATLLFIESLICHVRPGPQITGHGSALERILPAEIVTGYTRESIMAVLNDSAFPHAAVSLYMSRTWLQE